MAAVNFFDNFETLWAQAGALEVIDDNQYKQGWAYIGATPPSVEQFNKVQQLSDQKAAWLFAQIKELAAQRGYALTAPMVDALTTGIAASMQAGMGVIGTDTGAANAYVVNFTPAIAELKDGMALWFKVKTANTGASTLNVNGLGARQIIGMGHSALQGGELVANGKALVVWKADSNSWVLVACSGAAAPVAPATKSGHAVQFSQVAGIVGLARNLRAHVPSANSSATIAADELIVESALGGLRYCLPNFSQTINLATTGAGGMDTGTAPASGSVAIYAIYNPTTNARALLGQDATSAARGETYTGANMPAGFTASALVSVWRTNASRQLLPGFQRGRRISCPMFFAVQNSATPPATATALTLAVPANAIAIWGELLGGASAPAVVVVVAGADAGMAGQQAVVGEVTGPGGGATCNYRLDLITPRQIYWSGSVTAGTPNVSIGISGYEF